MKNFRSIMLPVFVILFLNIFVTQYCMAYIHGISGRTLKTSSDGCGSCHGPVTPGNLGIIITNLHNVTPGQSITCTVTVLTESRTKTGTGLNISVRSGSLSVVDPRLHLMNGELTQNTNIALVNGIAQLQFTYTAPAFGTVDTIFAAGVTTNRDSLASGDDWNFAISSSVTVSPSTTVHSISENIPVNFKLEQNYPNPFNPETTIKFSLTKSSLTRVTVYNLIGQQVAELVNESLQPSTYEVRFNASALTSGIYFYKLISGDITETKKMLLIK